jgi:hypothetical protein
MDKEGFDSLGMVVVVGSLYTQLGKLLASDGDGGIVVHTVPFTWQANSWLGMVMVG